MRARDIWGNVGLAKVLTLEVGRLGMGSWGWRRGGWRKVVVGLTVEPLVCGIRLEGVVLMLVSSLERSGAVKRGRLSFYLTSFKVKHKNA